MPRFFLENADGNAFSIEGQDARHIACSLRMKEGDALTVCNGQGTDFECELVGVSPERIDLAVKEVKTTVSEPTVRFTLYQGLPKGDKLELIIQKAVELGVYRIVPVVTARSIAKMSERDVKKVARWQKIADEAAGQSGRGILPQVSAPITFKQAAAEMANTKTVVFYECGGEKLTAIAPTLSDEAAIFIGPEGGIAPDEIETLTQNGATLATLGPRILRCETAPIAALAALMALTDNM